jgi:FAD dependent oxidoreductase central domain
MGLAPELGNYYVLAGFNSSGIAFAGGAGMALAQWIVAGEPDLDLSAVDIRRFASRQGNTRWLRQRVQEIVGLHFAMAWPNREPESARGVRRSPVHHLLDARGATRLEKGYRAFGRELGPDTSPAEAGLLFACKLSTAIPFRGREAVERHKAQGVSRRLVSLVVSDPSAGRCSWVISSGATAARRTVPGSARAGIRSPSAASSTRRACR